MKIVKFFAENIKRLKVVEITPASAVVTIAGPNANGKSSILDSIFYAIAGTKNIPSQPIRHGEDHAVIKLDLGEVKITRRFTASGSSLVVEAASGARFPSPQKLLDDLVNGLSFDPLAFTRDSPKQQLETLKKLVKLDVDVDALDGLNQNDFERRTEINREVKRLEAQIAAIPQPEIAIGATWVDESDLLAGMERASTHNMKVEREIASRVEMVRRIALDRAQAAELRERADKLDLAANEAEELYNSFPPVMERIDAASLRQQIEQVRETNAQLKQKESRDHLVGQLAAIVKQVEDLTLAMSDRARLKEQAIANAEMPVKGLAFGDGEVLFQGVPFAQASSAEQLMVSTVLAMALNPRLRIIRISDGSLLDESNLTLLRKLAERSDFQVWLEQLSSTDPCAIHLCEGEVVGAPAVGLPPVGTAGEAACAGIRR